MADQLIIQRLSRRHGTASRPAISCCRRRGAWRPATRAGASLLEAGRALPRRGGQTEGAVQADLDAKLPNRKAALEARRALEGAGEAQIAASTTRNLAAALAGDRAGAARASISACTVTARRTDQEPGGLRITAAGAVGKAHGGESVEHRPRDLTWASVSAAGCSARAAR